MRPLFHNAVQITNHIVQMAVQKGDIVVDATVGNGNDTLSLLKLVGTKGKVYGFDIQLNAIKKTRQRLEENDAFLAKKVTLIQDSHEKIDQYVKEEIDFIMFNLGYLPSGDHRITTTAGSTISAIKKSIDLLKPKGVITICVYPGHEEGKREQCAIQEMVSKLDQKKVIVTRYSFENQVNSPPFLYILQKNHKNY